jgi:hypothetical protein
MRTVASDEPVAIVPNTLPGEGRKSREAIPLGWAESRVKRWAPVFMSHKRIDRSPEADILKSAKVPNVEHTCNLSRGLLR